MPGGGGTFVAPGGGGTFVTPGGGGIPEANRLFAAGRVNEAEAICRRVLGAGCTGSKVGVASPEGARGGPPAPPDQAEPPLRTLKLEPCHPEASPTLHPESAPRKR